MPPRARRGSARFQEPAKNALLSEDDDSSSSTDSGTDDGERAQLAKHAIADGGASEIFAATSFDAYFAHASKPSKTSNNVFSALIEPLSPEEYAAAMRMPLYDAPRVKPHILSDRRSRAALFAQYCRELRDGFNLVLYGFGSKKALLNSFASEVCSTKGHVVVVDGSQPGVGLKDVMTGIERVPGVPASAGNAESQAERVHDFFYNHSERLYVIIHNIDAAGFRGLKAKSSLSLLALNPRIHLIASIDHVNAPLLWTNAELSARKPGEDAAMASGAPRRGFGFLWHNVTTLLAYDSELARADRSSITGAAQVTRGKQKEDMGAGLRAGGTMTETAAMHILVSVTQKAKKLFGLMAEKQLEQDAEGTGTTTSELEQYAISYEQLFTAARDNFIATNDTALQALLGEFRDHGLVLAGQGVSGGEVYWIPIRRERLASIMRTLLAEQH